MKPILFISKFSAVAGIVMHLALAPVYAADQQRPSRDERHAPPAEAFTACEYLQEKDACNFTGRNEEMLEGVCVKPRKSKAQSEDDSTTLVCRPNKMPAPSKETKS